VRKRQFFLHDICQMTGIFYAVAVTDVYKIVGTGDGGFAHFLCQSLNGGLSAPGF
jgi:hypothetical protein